MHIKKDDIPLVAFPHDELWIEFRDQPLNAVIWVSALTAGAVVEVASGTTNDPALLTAPVSTTLTQKGEMLLETLPIPAGTLAHRFVRVRSTNGRISVSLAGPLEFRHYLKSLIT